jgi:flagellin-specific chaperone FliS
MFVAQELRKKSIAEYLLYMWQIEDIIRAYGCSLPVIKKNYVDRFDFTSEQREDELDWFGNLIRMMNEEGKREGGHLNINKVILKDVIDLHGMLLQSTKFPIYNAEYYKVLPFIVELRQRGDKDLNEIETCLDALYGVMMLRLQKKNITPETERAIKEITVFIGLLSDYYIKDRTEGLKFDDDDM